MVYKKHYPPNGVKVFKQQSKQLLFHFAIYAIYFNLCLVIFNILQSLKSHVSIFTIVMLSGVTDGEGAQMWAPF